MEWECLRGLGLNRSKHALLPKPEMFTNKKAKKKKKLHVKDRFGSYNGYLHSNLWKGRKGSYWATHRKICFCCAGPATELHHCSYNRLGREKDKDLVPLCRNCHEHITDMVYNKEAKLEEAHVIYKGLLELRID